MECRLRLKKKERKRKENRKEKKINNYVGRVKSFGFPRKIQQR